MPNRLAGANKKRRRADAHLLHICKTGLTTTGSQRGGWCFEVPRETQTVTIYSNRSLTGGPFCRFGEECMQDLSWREMEALSGMRPFILATWPDTIAFQSDKHPVSDRGTGRWGLAIRNRY